MHGTIELSASNLYAAAYCVAGEKDNRPYIKNICLSDGCVVATNGGILCVLPDALLDSTVERVIPLSFVSVLKTFKVRSTDVVKLVVTRDGEEFMFTAPNGSQMFFNFVTDTFVSWKKILLAETESESVNRIRYDCKVFETISSMQKVYSKKIQVLDCIFFSGGKRLKAKVGDNDGFVIAMNLIH